uniref:NF-X1-type domain-containing protein n=1 Tax=Globisporangium ultimum (strain ATCC 200006 / CBS 805.95 / DAOM BR144) TaxID=431595 RepID=K3X2E8_GLOUD
RYKAGSLVCIASGVATKVATAHLADGHDDDQLFPRYANLAAQELIFATVCESKIEDFSTNLDRFSISLKLLDTSETVNLVTTLTDRNRVNLLIEVRGLFFPAYEPILRTLQDLNTRNLAPELQQCLYGDVGQHLSWRNKPKYAQGIQAYNLQFLVKKDDKSGVNLSHVPVENFEQLVKYLRPFEKRACLTLDETQVEAFAAALTQQVCLIQGPPGTGKSYVGTKIVQGILNQRHLQIGPILCVCYTNHALDQFLEDLVKDGVPVERIVRVGSRSKSEVLEQRTLSVLKKTSLSSRQEGYRFGQLRSECQKIEVNTLDDFVETSTSPKSFFKWMECRHPHEYASIVGLEDEDGFQVQCQSKEGIQTRWNEWKRNNTRHTGTSDMWKLSARQRAAQVAQWKMEWRGSVRADIKYQLDKYYDYVAQAEEIDNARMLRILKSAKVVGITTTGCAMHQALIRALAPEIIVCEEAGEVLEAHLLACLSHATQQVIQIGDHMQLRPILNEYVLSHSSNGGYNLDISMFERLVGERVDTTTGGAKVPGSLVSLHVQRRMRPEICDLVRCTLYPKLADGPQVYEYPDTRGFTHNLWFFDHDAPENTGELSCKNTFEAEMIVELVAYAIKQGYGADEITILTPYLGQLVLIRSFLQVKNFRFALDEKDAEAIQLAGIDDSDNEESEKISKQTTRNTSSVVIKTLKECVRLSTVDNFQGNESHLVFISTVRSNDRGRTGFLKTFNRVNVMLSRAKSAMFILGSAATVRRSSKATMFNRVLDILEDKGAIGRTIGLRCQKHGTVHQAASALDIRSKSPDGGCGIQCNQRLSCGHGCPKLCHADDPRHVTGFCMEPCVRRVAVCGHFCKSRCYESCRCKEIIPLHTFPCGHTLKNANCLAVHAGTLRCQAKVMVQMPFCKHSSTVSCEFVEKLQRAVERNNLYELWKMNVQCNAICNKTRTDCKHVCQRSCGACMASSLEKDVSNATESDMMEAGLRKIHFGKCAHPCKRMLFCGHSCSTYCHPAGSCPPCPANCRNECSHSKCSQACKEPCVSCAQPCTWTCSHYKETCALPCGSPCTRFPCDLRCPKQLGDCGHQCPGLCGEPCLTSAFCRECPPTVCTQGDEVVDLVMAASLRDHDPDESPLVQLRCGHTFTIETLDGCLSMTDFYEQAENGEWVGVKPLKTPKDGIFSMNCPVCRAPVSGVHRYGRLLNFNQLAQSELKYLHSVVAQIESLVQKREQIGNAGSKAQLASMDSLVKQFRALSNKDTPTQDVWTKESSQLEKLGFEGSSFNLNSYRNIMQNHVKILVNLELLELLVLKVQSIDVEQSQAYRNHVTRAFDEGIQLEKTLGKMCLASESHSSASKAILLGMQLRVAFLGHNLPDDESKLWRQRQTLVNKVEDSLSVLLSRGRRLATEMLERAQHLCDLAKRLGHLSKAEKLEIFKVFAKGNDDYARGYGGRWYVVDIDLL